MTDSKLYSKINKKWQLFNLIYSFKGMDLAQLALLLLLVNHSILNQLLQVCVKKKIKRKTYFPEI